MKGSKLKRLDIVTLFPAMFEGPLSESLLGKARDRGLVDVIIHNLRDFSPDKKFRRVDDRPYGGGAGMVLQAEPIFKALQSVSRQGRKALKRAAVPYVLYLSPQGTVLRQDVAATLVTKPWLILLCGHYEGIDERAMVFVDEEVSIGDFVLTGGELPAMVVAEAVMRLVPGVVKEEESIANDSFQNGLLDHPHYTRPAVWRKKKVPEILLSGDHEKIRQWRSEESHRTTAKKRPDLLDQIKKKKG